MTLIIHASFYCLREINAVGRCLLLDYVLRIILAFLIDLNLTLTVHPSGNVIIQRAKQLLALS
jgi:hypothetical protein